MAKSAINVGFPGPNYVVETTDHSAILPGLYLVETTVVTLSSDAGSYTLSGQAARFSATLPAGAGSFALSGKAATFRDALTAADGSYTLSGQDLPAVPTGHYTLTGEPAALRVTMAAGAGIYALTGEALSFRPALVAPHGSYTLTGESATLSLSNRNGQTAVTIICG